LIIKFFIIFYLLKIPLAIGDFLFPFAPFLDC